MFQVLQAPVLRVRHVPAHRDAGLAVERVPVQLLHHQLLHQVRADPAHHLVREQRGPLLRHQALRPVHAAGRKLLRLVRHLRRGLAQLPSHLPVGLQGVGAGRQVQRHHSLNRHAGVAGAGVRPEDGLGVHHREQVQEDGRRQPPQVRAPRGAEERGQIGGGSFAA